MKHILVPIGSSDNATNTLQYAIDLASEMGSEVFVFRAYSVISKAGTIINIDEIVSRETQLYLQGVVKQVDTKNVNVKIISAKGSPVDSINAIHDEFGIDLVIIEPRSNSIKEELFLGSTTGSIVKQTDLPVLVVPEGYTFSPFSSTLMAFKSGSIKNKTILNPLFEIIQKFSTKVNLLLVKTPDYKEEDLILDKELEKIKSSFSISENVTIFQGVLEHFQSNNPDLLCVFRRKRGFFQKLWESNTISKSQFHCSIPLLVLSGTK